MNTDSSRGRIADEEILDFIASDDVAFSLGQSGEDLLLLRLLGAKRNGFYVDVGAHHPRRYSNTFLLHRLLQWSGINIDPSVDCVRTFARERPNDINLALAIGTREAETTYWKFGDPFHNTVATSRRDALIPYGEPIGEERVTMRPLAAVLREHLPPGCEIDLLNIDTAGGELDVLHSNDWDVLRPAVVAVDDAEIPRGGASPIRHYAEGQGYRFIGQLFATSFYGLPDFLEATGFAPNRNFGLHTPATLQATKAAVSALVAETRFLRSRFTERVETPINERRHFSEAQAASLSRQLHVLRAQHDALLATVAWRFAIPIHKIEKEIGRWRRRRVERRQAGAPNRLKSSTSHREQIDVAALKAAYLASPISVEPDTFVLYRIIGNDLLPRHRRGQSRDNVAFILANEPELESCEKRWVVNRISDPGAEAEIIDFLESHGQQFVHIPFRFDEYARTGWALEDFPEPAFFLTQRFRDLEHKAKVRAELHARWRKNAYLMNNNGARNAALADGRGAAKWVLPWDGNCFVSGEAWRRIRGTIAEKPYLRYFIVPMARIVDDSDLQGDRLHEKAKEEPQIVFRRDANETFDERFVYGRRSKVELLMRLGVPGPWDRWQNDPWDTTSGAASIEAGQFATTGWVARLNSGVPELEANGAIELRGQARADAIISTIDRLSQAAVTQSLNLTWLTFYDEAALDTLASGRKKEALADQLRCDADLVLARGPYSVVDKTTLPPSGDPHDYWHLSPYWWPNPDTPNGLPYIQRDGQRVPGTKLYEPDSEQFDRTRLQRLFDDTTVAALAWRVHGDDRYIEHAARLIRGWFVDPETKMNPHLRFAQVRRGHDGDEGNSSGVIEFKDVYYFLDAVRLAARAGALGDTELAGFRSWMRSYLGWLEDSRQGLEEARKANNHGTFYDLQVAAIAAFIPETASLVRAFRRARERMLIQFSHAGAQPQELRRPMTRHYCCFNLQGWVNLARLADVSGDDLWTHTTSNGRGIGLALEWLVRTLSGDVWPYPDTSTFEEDRLSPLIRDFDRRYRDGRTNNGAQRFAGRAVYHPTAGIAPYWMLARP